MPILDIVNQFIENSNISKAFGIDVNNFLILILGSIIVGYTCLTFYYKIFSNNQRWTKLDYFEKVIVSLVIGFFSVLVSIYTVTVYSFALSQDNRELLGKTFLQMTYILPFLYFISFSKITAKYDYKELDFIKKYIGISFGLIIGLNFAFMLIIFYIIRSWAGFALTIPLIIFLLILYKPWKVKEYLQESLG